MIAGPDPAAGPDRRSWDVAAADAFLPALDRLLDSVAAGVRRGRAGPDGADPRLLVHGLMAVLNEEGVVVRDLNRRLVDFPSVGPEGETVLLCRIGAEPRVEWWHHPETGFAGRRHLNDDPPW